MYKIIGIASIIWLHIGCALYAQDTAVLKGNILSDIEKMSGIYYSYSPPKTSPTAAPKGYKPFYISHYGRHGFRWNSSSSDYERPLRILEQAASQNALTESGQKLLEQVRIVVEDARDRHGDLMPMGEEEHRNIAERMYNAYPQVFAKDKQVHSYSTAVARCILSMTAFDERLKELTPRLRIIREATKRNQYFMCNTDCADRIPCHAKDSIVAKYASQVIKTKRFIDSIFSDTTVLAPCLRPTFMSNIFTMAGTLKGRENITFSLYGYFTPDEMFGMWQQSNHWLYLAHGPSAQFADSTEHDARHLIRHIVVCADSAIRQGPNAAHLRFGHDFGFIPLMAAMHIEGADRRVAEAEKVWEVWQNFSISPMASNVQLIFYRSKSKPEVLVKILLNEEEARLPIQSINGCYYKWMDIKNLWGFQE